MDRPCLACVVSSTSITSTKATLSELPSTFVTAPATGDDDDHREAAAGAKTLAFVVGGRRRGRRQRSTNRPEETPSLLRLAPFSWAQRAAPGGFCARRTWQIRFCTHMYSMVRRQVADILSAGCALRLCVVERPMRSIVVHSNNKF